jgi:precorrin-2 dehydrogenase/sirohydrochlorin ferrochelatase
VFYPLLIDLGDRPVLVVGGGVVAERKVDSLVEAGANVTVVAPHLTERLQTLADAKSIHVHRRRFEVSDLEGMQFVITATDEKHTQEAVAAAARDRNVLVNTVDTPALCDFIVPAVIRRGDVVVAISTSGRSPALSAALRAKLEGIVTPDTGRAARILGEIRKEVHERFAQPDQRKDAFEQIVNSGILDWISESDDEAALKRVRGIIEKLS